MKQISKMNKIYSYFLILIVLSVSLNLGCGSSGYKKPITKFRDASAVTVEGARVYISELNKVEREKYIVEQVAKKSQIVPDDMTKRQVFSEEGLQARMDALDALSNYGDLLYKLANSDAPEKITAQAKSLKGALEGLSGTVGGLTGDTDGDFKNAVGPATAILGIVLELIVQSKIKEGLDKAILNGEVPINNLISVIGEDLRSAYVGQKRRFSRERLALIDAYNEVFLIHKAEIERGAQADQNKLLALSEKMKAKAAEIRDFENKWETLGNANPLQPLTAMAKAHSALINFAKSKQKIGDFQSLVDSVEFFAIRAEQFGTAVRALRELSE